MAPVKPKARLARKSTATGPSKSKMKKTKLPSKMQKQVKTKPMAQSQKPKNKRREYTEEQLNLPTLNSIIPAIAKESKKRGTGKKKNKVYVDDQESMMTILAMVNAEKEGQIESKIMKQRQMEEIREARRKEAEKRAENKKGKFEEVKQDIKEKRRRRRDESDKENQSEQRRTEDVPDKSKKKKRVSFA